MWEASIESTSACSGQIGGKRRLEKVNSPLQSDPTFAIHHLENIEVVVLLAWPYSFDQDPENAIDETQVKAVILFSAKFPPSLQVELSEVDCGQGSQKPVKILRKPTCPLSYSLDKHMSSNRLLEIA